MMFPLIHCYHPGAPIPPNSFFIIRTGPLAGKPITGYDENTYIVKCPNRRYCEFFFWLVEFLHTRKKITTKHKVIQFEYVNKEEIRMQLQNTAHLAFSYWEWEKK